MSTKSPHPKRAQAKRAKAEYVKAGVLPRLISATCPRVVIEFEKPKQARSAARFWNLGEEGRVRMIAKHLFYNVQAAPHESEDCWLISRAILNLIAPK